MNTHPKDCKCDVCKVYAPAQDVLTSPLETEGGESLKNASTPVQVLPLQKAIDSFHCIQGLRTGICCPFYSETLHAAKQYLCASPAHKFTAEELCNTFWDSKATFGEMSEAGQSYWQRLADYVNSKYQKP